MIATALADQTDYDHRWLMDPRTGEVVFWTSDTGIDGENRDPAGEGSVRHVEVFLIGSVRTPIIGRPRPLPSDRRAATDYTLNCDEPIAGSPPKGSRDSSSLGACDHSEVALSDDEVLRPAATGFVGRVRAVSGWVWALVVVLATFASFTGYTLRDAVEASSAAAPPITRACGTLAQDSRVTAAWGPDRELFTLESPAPFATLNSITDNPNHGDERIFFEVKDQRDTESGGFCNSKEVEDGQILLLRWYVENSAANNLVDDKGIGEGLAENVTIEIAPDVQSAALRTLTAKLSSSTTSPREIYSTVELVAPYPFRLDYIVGSSRLYSNAHPNPGLELNDVWGQPVLLGYEELDGNIRPGYQYALIGTLDVRVTRVSDNN